MKAAVKGFAANVAKFFRDTKSELKKVVWPAKADIKTNTVVAVSYTHLITVVLNLPRLAGVPSKQAHLITPQKRCYHCITSFSIRQAEILRFFWFFAFSFSRPVCAAALASRT